MAEILFGETNIDAVLDEGPEDNGVRRYQHWLGGESLQQAWDDLPAQTEQTESEVNEDAVLRLSSRTAHKGNFRV